MLTNHVAKQFLSLLDLENKSALMDMFEQMEKVRRKEPNDVELCGLDCSLPGNPSINLLPELVGIYKCKEQLIINY